jgi:hypothetical protein
MGFVLFTMSYGQRWLARFGSTILLVDQQQRGFSHELDIVLAKSCFLVLMLKAKHEKSMKSPRARYSVSVKGSRLEDVAMLNDRYQKR